MTTDHSHENGIDLPAAAASGRPTWSGLLQLSLVAIPVKAYPAACPREGS